MQVQGRKLWKVRRKKVTKKPRRGMSQKVGEELVSNHMEEEDTPTKMSTNCYYLKRQAASLFGAI